MPFPCPVPLCKHHALDPFSTAADLQQHEAAAQHNLCREWIEGPAPPWEIEVDDASITVGWNPVAGATHYVLQMRRCEQKSGEGKCEEAKWAVLGSGRFSRTAVRKKKLGAQAAYAFRVRAVDTRWTGGCESPYSAPSEPICTLSTDQERERPNVPVLRRAQADALTLEWSADTAAKGYDVQMRQGSSGWASIATVKGTALRKKGLSPCTSYFFRVRPSRDCAARQAWSRTSEAMQTSRRMNPFVGLLGSSLVDASGRQHSTDVLLEEKLVMLYFSASWCPPCRQFTPQLAAFYKMARAKRYALQIVFVSSDRDEPSFAAYLSDHHPWLAIPFSSPHRGQTSNFFQVSGIPSLMVFTGATGKLLTADARSNLSETALASWVAMASADV